MAAAMDERMSENVANQLDTLHSNLKLVTEQLKEGESRRQTPEDFSLPTFWERLSATFKIMSHEATKMCLMFSKPPVPSEEESKSLIQGVEKSVLAMISTFYSLPKDQGMTLRKSVCLSVTSVVDELQDLVNHIIKNVGKGSSSQLFATGSVWECCEDFSKLPKDNKEAVLLIIRNTTSLVQDALQEIEEARDNDANVPALDQLQLEDSEEADNSEQSWTESDKSLMAPCLGLVKAAKACLKKVSGALKSGGKCDTVDRIAQLDDIADVVNQTSPHVDDTVLSLYPLMDHSAVRTNALALSGVLKNLLDMAKSSHFTTEADSSWLQFLQNAVDHNVDKVRDLTQDHNSS
ncbi:PREDICTED: cyclin-D1-binding protein 1 homolog [Branchiostoma belcheri]|uniref:Cyclin-D1-binding protein 1 homolog n=1 Tax=Branchiostoma belcheri TaxID=7741 RepID=A0A6P4ZTM1_BRABE|nr:PREDICTED: cyclin-D1-binding protein 1 homolog [Branchiostoma belcheri]